MKNKQINQGFKAAIFWKIIPARLKKNIAKLLTLDEIQNLNHLYSKYQNLGENSKKSIGQSLYKYLQIKIPGWPIILSIIFLVTGSILIVLHFVIYPKITTRFHFEIFSVLLIGIVSPLMIYFLPWYKRKILFNLQLNFTMIFISFIIYLALIWLLVEINQSYFKNFSFPFLSTIILLFAVMTAPLFEEIVFRELLPSFFGKDPFYFGQLISAILFATAHMPDNLEMFILYFIASALLGMLRILSGGLIYGFIVHSIANAVVLLV